MGATITSIYFGSYVVTQSDYFIETYYNSKQAKDSTPKMIKMHSLAEEINHPLKEGHHFMFQDYVNWLDHTNSAHAKSTTNTFIAVYVILGIIISAVLKIVGLWVMLYCVNGA